MNGEDFQQFLPEELVPKLWSGAVQTLSAQIAPQKRPLQLCCCVMDNLPAHKVKGVRSI